MRFQKIPLEGGWAAALDHPPVEIGDRLVAAQIHVHLPGSASQPQIDVLIDSATGTPRCREVRLMSVEGGPEVRTKDMRLLDLDDLTERIVPLFATSDYARHADGSITAMVPVLPDSSSPQYREARAAVRSSRRATRRTLTDDVLRRVAEAYSSDPDRPVKAVQLAEGVSRATAFRYVKEARDRGLLPGRD